MDHENALLSCPLCEFSDYDSYFLSQHVDLCHPEDEDPPSITDGDGGDSIDHSNREDGQNTQCHSSNTEQEKQYIDCPEGCGEIVTAAELSLHMDLHMAENFALEDILPSSESKTVNSAGCTDEQETHSDMQASKSLHDYEIPKIKHSHRRRGRRSKEPGTKESTSSTKGGSIRKLGRAELGPHAHEKQMPAWLRKMLEGGAKVTLLNRISPNGLTAKDVIVENETPQIIPILIQLCGQDPTVRRAFFCSPAIRHVFKMPREGGFCGYRNIQMLISHIQDSQRPGHEHFPGSLPSILKLQDMIEQAWDMGFNAVARLETGGIRGTRKYIGTPEAQALFLSLGIGCDVNAFTSNDDVWAYDALFQDIINYFRHGSSSVNNEEKVLKTNLPPIYLQHRGHSMTIIGFEFRDNGGANLLVFDPMFKTSPAIQRLMGKTIESSDPGRLLKAYRRGENYLRKYEEFEILKLSSLNINQPK